MNDMRNVLLYVSGHGFGHAMRAGEVVRALIALRPDWTIQVATSAPRHFFPDHPSVRVRSAGREIDSGVAEVNPLNIDPLTTLRRVKALFDDRDELISAEAAIVRRERIDLVIADIPYLAGYIAEAAGIPCLGIANFTWDWILEPYLADNPRWGALLEWIRGGYARMDAYLKLPFSHPVSGFREVIEVPLVARQSHMDRRSVLRELRLDPEDERPRVLLAMRGSVPPGLLEAVLRDARDFLFLDLEPREGALPENIRNAAHEVGVGFPELLSVSDVVVAKLGYGTVAEVAVAGSALLYPPRSGFREDELLRAGAARLTRSCALPLVDFHSGRWALHLRELLALPKPAPAPEPAGARVCAEEIARRFQV